MAYEFTRLQDEEIVSSISDNAHVFVEDGNGVKRVSKDLVGGGFSVPTITIEESQITSEDPLTIQFTTEQAAIIENSDNTLINVDASALGYGLFAMTNFVIEDSAILSCSITEFTTQNNFCIGYDGSNKQGQVNVFKISPETKTDDMTQSVGIDEGGRLWTAPGGSSIPTVTVAVSQVVSQDPIIIQFTTEQRSIIENTANQIVIIDGIALGFGKIAMISDVGSNSSGIVLAYQSRWTRYVVMYNISNGQGEIETYKVNPDAKTSAMTQSVGIDEEGKLWTAPGSGGGLPSVTGSGKALVSVDGEWVQQSGYGYEVVGQEQEVCPLTTIDGWKQVSGGKYIAGLDPSPITSLIEGQTYKIFWGSQEYSCVAVNIEDVMFLGNLHFIASEEPDTGEPFCIVHEVDGTSAIDEIGCTSNTTTTLRITTRPVTVTKIDPKFIPDIGMPDPSEMDDGTAMVAIDGEWVEQTGYGYKEVTNITWDGNTEGKTKVELDDTFTVYQVSDSIANVESLIGNKLSITVDGAVNEIVIEEDNVMSVGSLIMIVANGIFVAVALEDDATIEEITFPNSGIYFLKTNDDTPTYVTNLEVAEFTKFSPGYIPLPGISDGSADGSIRTSGSKQEDEDYTMGVYAFAEGYETIASGGASHAEGYVTTAFGDYSHAEGSNTAASGYGSHAEGCGTVASGYYSHVEGSNTMTSGYASHTEGWTDTFEVITEGLTETTEIPFIYDALQEGLSVNLLPLQIGQCVTIILCDNIGYIAEYYDRTITNISISSDTTVTPHKLTVNDSVDFTGYQDSDCFIYILGAQGVASHSEGFDNTVTDYAGHVEGAYNNAVGIVQHVQGMYAAIDTVVDPESSLPVSHYLDIVGNGNFATGTRSNASALDWEGNLRLHGNVYVNCNDDSSGGTLLSGGLSIPTITINLSQVLTDDPLTVQFTDEQAAIIDTNANPFIYLDVSALELPVVMVNNINATSTYRNLVLKSVITNEDGIEVAHDDWCVRFTKSNKQGVLSNFQFRPVVKTSAMTQSVGIDSDGRLWTAPGGGGGGLPDPSEMEDGTALVVVDGEWTEQEGYGYSYTGENVLANESLACTTDTYSLGIYNVPFSTTFELTVGETYKVTVDGTTRTETAYVNSQFMNAACLGDLTNGYIVAYLAGATVFASTTSGTYAVKIFTEGTVYSQFDSNLTGVDTKMAKSNPVGTGSLSLNRKANTTVGVQSVAVGYNCEASGMQSFAEGYNTAASGMQSFAEGSNTAASGYGSHAEGDSTVASGSRSHAEGYLTTAFGDYSHAEGYFTTASGSRSHTEGSLTTAVGDDQHVQGRYNKVDYNATKYDSTSTYVINDYVYHDSRLYKCITAVTSPEEFDENKWEWVNNIYADIVGNGTDTSNRSNASALDWSGNLHLAGNVYVGCNADSSGGTMLISVPAYTSADEGKVLRIVNGVPAWVSITNAEDTNF